MNKTVQQLVERLKLLPHPEGGYYRETYRSAQNHSTAIYFLLTSGNFSALHRIPQDEVWHFYQGSPVYVHVIDKDGNYIRNIVSADNPQLVVKGGDWFGASVVEPDSYSLVGCTVAPAFEFTGFELAKRDHLTSMYPEHEDLIASLTRG
jgi:predicted cupin superfamily sugar epimerase